MTTYGVSDLPSGKPAFAGKPSVCLGHEVHGLSVGYRAALEGIEILPAEQWLRRFAKAPGIRKDARVWYEVDGWLEDLVQAGHGAKKISAADIEKRLDLREFSLRAGWVEWANGPVLVVCMEGNPSCAEEAFYSVHHDEENVLLHVSMGRGDGLPGGTLELREVQSDWQQEAHKSGTSPTPSQHNRQAGLDMQQRSLEAHQATLRCVDAAMAEPSIIAAARVRLVEQHGEAVVAQQLEPMLLRMLEQEVRLTAHGSHLPFAGISLEGSLAMQAVAESFKAALEAVPKIPNAVPDAPFRSDWPRLALSFALAHAAGATDAQGRFLYDHVRIVSGDQAAEDSKADEHLCGLNWWVATPEGLEYPVVRIEAEVVDNDGNTYTQPAIQVPLTQLTSDADFPGFAGVRAQVSERIEAGEMVGYFDSDWFTENYEDGDPEGMWINKPLRRFYDSHLRREMRKVASSAGGVMQNSLVYITPEMREAMARRFGKLPNPRPAPKLPAARAMAAAP